MFWDWPMHSADEKLQRRLKFGANVETDGHNGNPVI